MPTIETSEAGYRFAKFILDAAWRDHRTTASQTHTEGNAEAPLADAAAQKPHDPLRRVYDIDYAKFEAIAENLEREEAAAKAKAQEENAYQKSLAACAHDHSRERQIYEKPTVEKLHAAERFRTLGNEAFRNKNYGLAAVNYRKALLQFDYSFPETDEESAWYNREKLVTHLNMAACKVHQQDWEEALIQCRLALELDPHNAKAFYRRGLVYLHLDAFDQAASALSSAWQRAPQDPSIRAAIAELHKKKATYHSKKRKVYTAMFQEDGTPEGHHGTSRDNETTEGATTAPRALDEPHHHVEDADRIATAQMQSESLGNERTVDSTNSSRFFGGVDSLCGGLGSVGQAKREDFAEPTCPSTEPVVSVTTEPVDRGIPSPKQARRDAAAMSDSETEDGGTSERIPEIEPSSQALTQAEVPHPQDMDLGEAKKVPCVRQRRSVHATDTAATSQADMFPYNDNDGVPQHSDDTESQNDIPHPQDVDWKDAKEAPRIRQRRSVHATCAPMTSQAGVPPHDDNDGMSQQSDDTESQDDVASDEPTSTVTHHQKPKRPRRPPARSLLRLFFSILALITCLQLILLLSVSVGVFIPLQGGGFNWPVASEIFVFQVLFLLLVCLGVLVIYVA